MQSLGGNSRTCLVACVSPSQDAFTETLSTLHFACRAKLVKNQMVGNFEVKRVVSAFPEPEKKKNNRASGKLQNERKIMERLTQGVFGSVVSNQNPGFERNEEEYLEQAGNAYHGSSRKNKLKDNTESQNKSVANFDYNNSFFRHEKFSESSNMNSESEKRLEEKNFRLGKEIKYLREKLKICEREREIALNALQQQTEHFWNEREKRKKIQSKLDQMEEKIGGNVGNEPDQQFEGSFLIRFFKSSNQKLIYFISKIKL